MEYIEIVTNTHVRLNRRVVEKSRVSLLYTPDETKVSAFIDNEGSWTNVLPTQIANGNNANTPFADMAEWKAYIASGLGNPGTQLTAQVVITVAGSTITHSVIGGRTVAAVVINDIVKNTGFTVAGSTITFIDGTTVSVDQVVTIIFA